MSWPWLGLTSPLQLQGGGEGYVTLPPGSVWTPDTFIRNERRSEVVVAPARAEYTRVWGDGTVLHSVMYTRQTATRSPPHTSFQHQVPAALSHEPPPLPI